MKIGFIGLGRMGIGMARNLLRAAMKYVLSIAAATKRRRWLADGAGVADSPAAACRGSEAVITMLADDPAVEQMVFGENGIAGALPGMPSTSRQAPSASRWPGAWTPNTGRAGKSI